MRTFVKALAIGVPLTFAAGFLSTPSGRNYAANLMRSPTAISESQETQRECAGYPVEFKGRHFVVPEQKTKERAHSSGVIASSQVPRIKGYRSIVRALGYPTEDSEDINCWAEAIRIRNKKGEKDYIKPHDILEVPDVPRKPLPAGGGLGGGE